MAFGVFFGPDLFPVLSNRSRGIFIGFLCECGFMCTVLYECDDRIWFLMGTSIICFTPFKRYYTKSPGLGLLILSGILPSISMGAEKATFSVLQPITSNPFFHIHIDSLGWKWLHEKNNRKWKFTNYHLSDWKWTYRKGTNRKTGFKNIERGWKSDKFGYICLKLLRW